MTYDERIKQALLAVSPDVWHFKAMPEPESRERPYIVWAEYGAGDTVFGSGRKRAGSVAGTVDLFTRNRDGEPLVKAVQEALDGVCAWRLLSVQYEEDTGLLHYEWGWEIEDGEIRNQNGG